jgi:putative ABC transport system ATP-binding protein
MHIIGLLDRPSSGTYLLEGEDVGHLDRRRQAAIRNQRIGFVFQQFSLLPRTTVLDNVLLPTVYGRDGSAAARARELLDQVGLGDRIKHRSNQLSGGQVQRVAIARALVMRPSIVLADEPTGNLDSKTSQGILELLQKINAKGATLVLITHEASIAQAAQRVIRLRDGQIVEEVTT